jgi:signal transduction protein with GAF and PtsI domain
MLAIAIGLSFAAAAGFLAGHYTAHHHWAAYHERIVNEMADDHNAKIHRMAAQCGEVVTHLDATQKEKLARVKERLESLETYLAQHGYSPNLDPPFQSGGRT